MAIVSSFGAITALTDRRNVSFWQSSEVGGSIQLGTDHFRSYGAIYAAQPAVRTVVEFFSRNIAQLGLHTFRRVSDTDRVRLRDHDIVNWFKYPNPGTTTYRLVEDLVNDLGIYFNAFWLKLRYRDFSNKWQLGLLRLPPEQMSVHGGLLPSGFTWTLEDGSTKEFAVGDVVHFRGYNPGNPLIGLSPMETLRRTLQEEFDSSEYRRAFFRNSARFEGVIERPKDAGKWDDEKRQQFRNAMRAFKAGGAKSGDVPVLEDGMTYRPTSWSAKDSEYTAGRKLRREEVAAAYHVPLPMVGILDHATFSNIKEQHKQLYQDCLGPWLMMIQQEIERQVLPEAEDRDGVYVEFNIAEKLKGSFEEQATSLQVLVGRPVMTVNEGRARLNLPKHDDPSADELAVQPGTGSGEPEQETVEGEPVRRQLPAKHGEDDDEDEDE
jgi:HK97 family phage portal protein